jgi:hypothetical protein
MLKIPVPPYPAGYPGSPRFAQETPLVALRFHMIPGTVNLPIARRERNGVGTE